MINFYLSSLLRLLSVASISFAATCPPDLAVPLTHGLVDDDGTVVFNGIAYPQGTYYREINDVLMGCVCHVKTCLRKCCPPGKVLSQDSCVVAMSTTAKSVWESVPVYERDRPVRNLSNFHLIHGGTIASSGGFCRRGSVKLEPELDAADTYRIQIDGRLFMPAAIGDDDPAKGYLTVDEYCADVEELIGGLSISIYRCLNDDDVELVAGVTNVTGMMISVPFLLVTLLVYAVLPEKRNLHGKCLMFYVSSLMLAYCFLIYIQLKSTLSSDPPLCISIGVLCLFFFLVSFFWMNVMCTDIWLTFSGKRNASEARKDNRRILFYGIYAVGIPVLLAVIVIVLNITLQDSKNSVFYPGIGEGQCFVISGIPTLIYFYGPMSALITLNVFFFVKTAITIKSIKKDTKILKRKESMAHRNDDEKQQMFKLYIKLLLVMGINWTMEIISWAVIWANNNQTPPEIWYFTDFCNALYGVFIFFIFVFKKKTWQSLKRRYYVFIGKPMQAHMTGSTQTRSSAVTSDCGEPEGGAMAMRSTAKPI